MPRIWLALKVALTAVLLGGLFVAVDLESLARVLRAADARWVALAVVVLLAQTLVLAWRFALLSHVLGRALGVRRAVELSFVGVLFNQALPSAVGGDAVRGWRLAASGWPWWSAASAVLVDRASGVVLLALLAAAAATFEPTHALRWLALPLWGIAAVCAAAFAALALGDRLPVLPRAWRARVTAAGVSATARAAVAPRAALGLAVLSAASHALAALAICAIAIALGFGGDAGLPTIAAAAVCVLLVTMIPLSFAGWGVREAGAVWVFGLVGLSRETALAVSLVFGAALLVAALPGIAFWLAPSATRGTDPATPNGTREPVRSV